MIIEIGMVCARTEARIMATCLRISPHAEVESPCTIALREAICDVQSFRTSLLFSYPLASWRRGIAVRVPVARAGSGGGRRVPPPLGCGSREKGTVGGASRLPADSSRFADGAVYVAFSKFKYHIRFPICLRIYTTDQSFGVKYCEQDRWVAPFHTPVRANKRSAETP